MIFVAVEEVTMVNGFTYTNILTAGSKKKCLEKIIKEIEFRSWIDNLYEINILDDFIITRDIENDSTRTIRLKTEDNDVVNARFNELIKL